jgi:hypothetical protein
MKSNRRINRLFSGLSLVGFFVLLGVAGFLAMGCDGDDEECLVRGENCTQQYKLDNYGTTEVQCCEGQCTDHGSGVLTCGS